MKRLSLLTVLISVFGVSALTAQNYKLRQVTSMNGQKMESTTYVRGMRKRTEGGGMMGMGNDVATIEQCDLKQNLKVNDKKRQYAVEPFETGETGNLNPAGPAPKPKSAPATKGGTITYVSNLTDTGERKTMFGMTARHVKTSMSVESSADACSKQDMKMETDGWYIDLPDFICPLAWRPQMPPQMGDRSGCQDRVAFRTTGAGKPGFPLTETRTMSMEGGMSFMQTLETLEFSKAALEAALFDIPEGYAKVSDSQQLYGRPDYAAMMRQAESMDEDKPKSSTASASSMSPAAPSGKRPGVIRIGVLPPTNKGDNVSITNMQAFLARQLNAGDVEGVPVGSEADARAASCDFLLSSDISKLKQSTAGKIGGMFGKVTNTGVSGNYEAEVGFQLTSLTGGQKAVQSKASSKTENNVDRAAESILSQEAAAVISAVKKN